MSSSHLLASSKIEARALEKIKIPCTCCISCFAIEEAVDNVSIYAARSGCMEKLGLGIGLSPA